MGFSMKEFTPLERRMLSVLGDGLPHLREELHACFNDELRPLTDVRMVVYKIRQRLRPHGHDIICQLLNQRLHFRHIRLLRGTRSIPGSAEACETPAGKPNP